MRRPLSVRHDSVASKEYDALHDGIPAWLGPGASLWLKKVLGPYEQAQSTLLVLEQHLRLPLDWSQEMYSAVDGLVDHVAYGGLRALDILDAALMVAAAQYNGRQLTDLLETMLQDSRSAWTVAEDADGLQCLERRVDETVEASARKAMSVEDNAGRHLHHAWHRIYGRDVDPSGAYREAVKAVEAAAKPGVIPKDPLATLGKMISALGDRPDKRSFELGDVTTVIDMMRRLWQGQSDRHGNDHPDAPLNVTANQAEAAVHLAVTLVHWFRNGHVRLA